MNGALRRQARLRELDRRLLSLRFYQVGLACIGLPGMALMVVLLLPIVRLAESALNPPIVAPVLLTVTLGIVSMFGYQSIRSMLAELGHEREELARSASASAVVRDESRR